MRQRGIISGSIQPKITGYDCTSFRFGVLLPVDTRDLRRWGLNGKLIWELLLYTIWSQIIEPSVL